MKIVFLWAELSGYMLACLEALKQLSDLDVLICYWPNRLAPFKFEHLNKDDSYIIKETGNSQELLARLASFEPDVVLLSGWMDKTYLKYAKALKKLGASIVCCMDTQWQNTLRQKLVVLTKQLNFMSRFDAFWVAGEKAAQFARRLQSNGHVVWHGLYTCDNASFEQAYTKRLQLLEKDNNTWPHNFLFVGQYRVRKGLDYLLKAYRNYRRRTCDPWDLHCAGDGPLKDRLKAVDGVVDHGFIQPDKLPLLFEEAGAFVLPSVCEPWGVVLHEACSAGLPIICSDACGASVELLQDGYNGYLFPAGNAGELETVLSNVATADPLELKKMSDHSYQISKRLSPDRWASYLVQKVQQLRTNPS